MIWWHLRRIRSPDQDTREQAIRKLVEARAVEGLLELLTGDETRETMAAAARALGEIGDLRAVPVIIGRLALIPQAGSRALARIGDDRALAPLAEILERADHADRAAALQALEQFGPAAIPVLRLALERTLHPQIAQSLESIGWKPEELQDLLLLALGLRQWEALAGAGHDAAPLLLRVLESHESSGVRLPLYSDHEREKALDCLGRIADPKTVLPLLRHGDDAMAALRAMGVAALGPLSEAVKHGAQEGVVRRRAAELLSEISEPGAQSVLVELLDDKDPAVARVAIEALDWSLLEASKRDRLVQQIVEPKARILADDHRWREWQRTLRELGSIRDVSVGTLLSDFLRRETISVPSDESNAAVQALGESKEQALHILARVAPQALMSVARQHQKLRWRFEAVRLLRDVPGESAAACLTECLVDSDPDVRQAAAAGLLARGWGPATEEEEARFFIAHGAWDELQNLGASAAAPMMEVYSKDPGSRAALLPALAQIDHPEVVETLISALDDESDAVGCAAIAALSRTDDPRARQGLLASLQGPNRGRRLEAARALGGLPGDVGFTAALLDALTALLDAIDGRGSMAASAAGAQRYLPLLPIRVSYASSSATDEPRDEQETIYPQRGFLLAGEPEGRRAARVEREEHGTRSWQLSPGAVDETLWLLESGDLLVVRTTALSGHAGRASSSYLWSGEAKQIGGESFRPGSPRAREALLSCGEELLSLLEAVLPASDPRFVDAKNRLKANLVR